VAVKMIKTIILARGGSKGIPQKNIIDIKGRPLIDYTIKAALNSLANDVWVSTDCSDIAFISKKSGAKTINRPKEISGDKNKSEEALLHFANNVDFDILIFIQPTSPLLLPEDINKGIQMIKNYDSIFSAYKEHWVPRWNTDYTPYLWNTNNRPMRQDMPEKYVENGALYITTKQALLASQCRYSGNIGILEMPLHRSFQIDTYKDLELITKLL
jgi:CMP-N-acetylneuraminic acid synthetase